MDIRSQVDNGICIYPTESHGPELAHTKCKDRRSARTPNSIETYHCALIVATIAAFKCVGNIVWHRTLIDVQITQIGIDTHDTPNKQTSSDEGKDRRVDLLELKIDSQRVQTEEGHRVGDDPLARQCKISTALKGRRKPLAMPERTDVWSVEGAVHLLQFRSVGIERKARFMMHQCIAGVIRSNE